MSNQTVREFLKEYSESKGWPVESDEDLIETNISDQTSTKLKLFHL